MSYKFLDSGGGAVIAGFIDASAGTDAVLTTTDGAATMSRTAAGDYTVTFNAPFNSSPFVVATTFDATDATTAAHVVTVRARSTAAVSFDVLTLTQAAGTSATDLAALADIDFGFIVVGSRNS